MLPLIINIVSVYVNSNRRFGININAIVIIICGLNLLGLVPGSVAYLGNLIGIGGIFV